MPDRYISVRLVDKDLTPPPTTSSSGGRGPGVGTVQRRGRVVPVDRTVPLAASESPSPACVLPPPTACLRRLRATRMHGKRGSLFRRGGAAGAAADGSAHQQRQSDNKIRQNVACQTGWFHGGDRSPYFGSALMLCCVLPFEAEAAAVSLSLCVSPFSTPSQVRLQVKLLPLWL